MPVSEDLHPSAEGATSALQQATSADGPDTWRLVRLRGYAGATLSGAGQVRLSSGGNRPGERRLRLTSL